MSKPEREARKVFGAGTGMSGASAHKGIIPAGGPATEVKTALAGFVSDLKDFQTEIKSKLQDQEERLTMLDRKSHTFGRPATRPALSAAQEVDMSHKSAFTTYVRNGGFVLVDDCNHDIDGLFTKSFERQMASIFGPRALAKLPNSHPIYRRFFKFTGPPPTGLELNGWGDDLVHDYLRGIAIGGRLGVLYSNKDYGCEWDYDWRNKRFLAVDNTRFAVNIALYALSA